MALPGGPPTQEMPTVAERGRHHAGEIAGTLLTAIIWGLGIFAAFVGLGFATHAVVAATVRAGSAPWRSVVGAVAAMFLVASVFALLLITGRGVSMLPRRVQERRARRPARPAPAAPAPPQRPVASDPRAPSAAPDPLARSSAPAPPPPPVAPGKPAEGP